ncbi:MAG TPA: hypothetical protein VEL28_14165 [Candidatus Binatia bacterium]|nr:hypothetical protein [Candidatus Binatia bacterium]
MLAAVSMLGCASALAMTAAVAMPSRALAEKPAAPAAGGAGATVRGSVTILDRDGNPKASHAGVIVFLDEMDTRYEVAAKPADQAIRQVDKKFIPEVLPVLAGTTVHFPNDDIVAHNVFSLSRVAPFDLGIYPRGQTRSVVFEETGLVKIYCNIHSRMVASIVVLANPWFTVTAEDGSFTLDNVPTGGATVRTWYPRTPQNSEQRLQVTEKGIYDLDLRLVEDLRLEVREESLTIQHKNKWGKDYPSKY